MSSEGEYQSYCDPQDEEDDMSTTEKVKHTSGPWTVGESDRNGQAIVRGPFYEIATCWHHCVKEIEQEMEANARLIAASPEMLSALEGAQEELRLIRMKDTNAVYDPTIRIRIREAIRRAKGE